MSDFINRLFDALAARWERTATRRVMAALLAGSFAVALLLIEAARQGWLPRVLQGRVPTNHFYAIDAAFTLFLAFEVVGLIFGLATSVANAAGKQVEIFSLILLRQSFKSLAAFPEPLAWQRVSEPVLRVLADAVGALVIFALIGFYYSLQQHRRIATDDEEQRRFVTAKKAVSLLLMGVFAGIGVYTVGHLLSQGEGYPFFDTFYTVLIFSDVLVVFISLGYSTTYHLVFRNSGFAVATMMIRLALAGPPFAGAAMGIVAALFMVGLTMAYNRFAPVLERFQRENRDAEQVVRRRTPEGPVADANANANANANADAGDGTAAAEPPVAAEPSAGNEPSAGDETRSEAAR